MAVVSADPEALRRAAGEVYEVADLLAGSFVPRVGELLPGQQAGWQALAQLQLTGNAWLEYTVMLGKRVESTGRALRNVADYLEAANVEAGNYVVGRMFVVSGQGV